MRVVADHADRRALELFAREIAPAGTSWSPGTTGPGGGRPSVSPLVKPFSFLLDKARGRRRRSRSASDARRSTCRSPAARSRAARRRRSRCPRRRADGEAGRVAAADPPRLGAQRRQGRPLQHRRRRAPRRVAAAAVGSRSRRRACKAWLRPPGARRGRALPSARHRGDQLRAARGARRRRPVVAPARSARQGHGADAARHADRGAAVDRARRAWGRDVVNARSDANFPARDKRWGNSLDPDVSPAFKGCWGARRMGSMETRRAPTLPPQSEA